MILVYKYFGDSHFVSNEIFYLLVTRQGRSIEHKLSVHMYWAKNHQGAHAVVNPNV